MAAFHLGCDIEFRRARNLRRLARRLALRVPGRIVQAGMGRVRHQFVIGGMKLNLVAAVAAGVESPELRRVLVGEPAPRRHRGGAPAFAELGQFAMRRRAAKGRNRIDQRLVAGEQIDVLEGRRLVENLVG
jgi:hypothetical protein